MIVRFTKPRHEDRPPTFTVIRDDGTTTGQQSTGFFVAHDLTHYAVETTLGLREAFYGLLASGLDISSFEDREPGSRKVRSLPLEAGIAEVIVGALDAQRADSAFDDAAVVAHVKGLLPDLTLDAAVIERIKGVRDTLFKRYAELRPGKSLDVPFPVQTPSEN